MPKRTDIKSILLIGSGPIVIGQACEFDYSGSQACKALREEGYRVILINSNPATIMTDPDMADRTYVEPLIPEVLEEIIKAERPDALLPTLGGQTGLNLATILSERGILGKLQRRADRGRLRGHQEGGRPGRVQGGHGEDRPRGAAERSCPQYEGREEGGEGDRFPPHHTAELYPGRHRRLRGLQHRGIRSPRPEGPRKQHDQRDPHRGVGDRLEGISSWR